MTKAKATNDMLSLVEKLKAASTREPQCMVIDEWVIDDEPVKIYYYPVTLREAQKQNALQRREGNISALADFLVMKCLNEDGEKIFGIEDKEYLRTAVPINIINKIVDTITGNINQEDMEKNSEEMTD